MLDNLGHIIEGTMSNLFVVVDGCLHTPDLSRAGVDGVMRQWILASASSMGLVAQVMDLTTHSLSQASEVFLCNSVKGVIPVARLEGMDTTWSAPGEVTTRIHKSWSGLWKRL